MAMPYIKEPQVDVAIPVQKRKPDEDKDYDGLEMAMEELHSCLMSKDYSGAAEIFRSCFELLDSEPHKEGPHE